jgi:CheY-specific phosphatase CheX
MNNTNHPLLDEVDQLLTTSVSQTLETMFALKARRGALESDNCREAIISCSVDFIGDINGTVHLYIKPSFASKLTSRMLSLAPDELEGESMVNDVIGELGNMIVGTVQSQLCDSGFACVLTIPCVMRSEKEVAEAAFAPGCRLINMVCDSEKLLLMFQIHRVPQR